ncbi:Peptide transporter PTR2 AltName: Full=Peptide permease PTR2 [Rhizoctonia solani AG-1 IB]|uniref:Rhizoctonia solani AG1-IB WGS project CAOJ00000000 data, isolate 7/3/14, contig 08054 n=1 Tax=Thanatephorus cucumeris (strain AG1-IB / isolate 7/3/14) TaxID=1108050 RepID=M5BPU3_THACB|nr:Peptide transporter PTR2 AltName: Full=Peptide permease PTR2 [Rhizoctonia solani AG-1 IB]
MSNNIVSQAGSMSTHGVPNDLLQNIDPIAIIIIIPLMDRIVYPGLRKMGWVTPAYVLIAASEIFASITGLEYAFTKAPLRMKSLVMAAFLFTTAISNAISEALVPVSEDPYLVWNYAGCGIAAIGKKSLKTRSEEKTEE